MNSRTCSWIPELSQRLKHARTLIKVIAAPSDLHAVSWLIAKMKESELARFAGEAPTAATGIEFECHKLQVEVPNDVSVVPIPNDDLEEEAVSPDKEKTLSWPNAEKADFPSQKYNQQFNLVQRYFMDKPIGKELLLVKIKTDFQRQRHAAPLNLALLEPMQMLINN